MSRQLNRPAVRLAVPLLAIAILGWRVGIEPFARAGQVLRPLPVAAALVLGLVTTLAQAWRWRLVADALQVASGLTRGRAVAEVYRAAFLNLALPGALAGDAVRAWRRGGTAGVGLRPAAGSVAVERVSGTVVLFAVAAVVAVPWSPAAAAVALAAAAGALALVAPGLRRLPARALAGVLGWSALAVAALLALVAVAAASLVDSSASAAGTARLLALGVILLAAGSVPLGLAGFGPREFAAAVLAGSAGLRPEDAVTVAAGFGLLAAVSVLPGALVMLAAGRPRPPRG